ncbi:hypothetical protein DNTS_001843 [Danionella cerebrum]|uniref:Uncharacterized protein n=1 Tax=Danionella cerebrum TaxID=2873325 RepID=A0A553RAD7_9TELE|nr:hypothetical protein DNTS_001843 [Danionella translucida]
MPKRREEVARDLWTSLLLVWITCVPYSSMAPLNNQSQSLQMASAMIPQNQPSEGQRILSRAKRGWVWNQMFVLEEFSGPDPILVGRRTLEYEQARAACSQISASVNLASPDLALCSSKH